MGIVSREVTEVKELCKRLNPKNRQYVLAVAQALQFSQDQAQKPRQEPETQATYPAARK